MKALEVKSLSRSSILCSSHKVTGETSNSVSDSAIPTEYTLNVYLGDRLKYSIICTPDNLLSLALGRLCSEGVISGVDDVVSIEFDEKNASVYVSLKYQNAQFKSLTRVEKVPTYGAQDNANWLRDDLLHSLKKLTPLVWNKDTIFMLAERFKRDTPLHRSTYGTHSCYALTEGAIRYCVEDLGRHNALDKVIGSALFDGIDLSQIIVFTSGRTPVDMVSKVIRARIPVLVSKAVPTDKAVDLAREYDLTLICSAHPDSIRVYNDPLGCVQAPNRQVRRVG